MLTIQGTLFNLGTPSVRLASVVDTTVAFGGAVTSSTSTQIVASFVDVAAGTYTLEVACGANIASSSSTIDVPLSASVSSSIESSIAGGMALTLTGSGFFGNSAKDQNKVTLCGFPCLITQSTLTSIQCQTPIFINEAVRSVYENLVSPSLLEGVAYWSDANKESFVFDDVFTSTYSSTQEDCQIGIDIGDSLIAELSEIKYFPNSAITASTLNGTVIEGSNDNSTYTLLATIDLNAHDGWNTISFAKKNPPARYRYFRIRGATSTAKCSLAELQFYGTVLSSNPVTDLNAINCKAKVTVNDKSQETAVAVTYKQSKTSVLTSISPEMGTTAGGTTVILTGENFDTTIANIKVLIDNVECTVSSATITQIVCVTGAAPSISNRRSSLESEIKILFVGQGYTVTNGVKYFYIDQWSDESTWGGITLPREGDSVHIPAGQTILLDTSPPKLKAIVIEGALIFEDTNIDLHCEYIFVRNGRLQIGTWEKPIQSKITITLYGNKKSPQLPTFGNKVIAMMEGILDIHGKPRSHTWTVLDTTAEQGATSIVIQGAVDWEAGEDIVIASTDHDHYQSESRTIVTATKDTPSAGLTTLTFVEPLKYRHYAGVQILDGEPFEMRAEVGLLTRNVVIQGDETSKKNLYGVHIMAHSSTGDDSSIGRISYTEVKQAGQAFNLGRYAIHFHLIGNVRQSYVIGNAIHHSYNRAVTIHGVHYLKVQKNVAYWCMGHTIFIEDGIETHNVIEDNLVVNTIASTALLNTDQTPASFWITNPNNIWRRNHAAGSDRYGFWFDLRAHPEGPSATKSICPTGERLGEFVDNQAHSVGRYGLRIFHELVPRTYPCQPHSNFEQNPPIQAEFKNFFGWKNRRNAIIGERLGAIKFKNIKAADNLRAGIEVSDGGDKSPADALLIEDAWIAGVTPDSAAIDLQLYIDHKVRGIITPKKDGFLAKNVHFYNFGEKMAAIETCSHCEFSGTSDAGARTYFSQGLTFSDVQQRVRFNVPYKEILIDRDGSLTDTPGHKGIVTRYYEHLDVPGCVRNETVYNGLVCDETISIRKIEFYAIAPFDSFFMQDLKVLRIEDNPNSTYGSIPFRGMTRNSWAVPVVMGYTYRMNWKSRADFSQVVVHTSPLVDENDKTVTVIFNHSEYREVYDIVSVVNKVNITNTTTLWDRTLAESKNCGDWYHDVTNQLLYLILNAKQKDDLRILSIKCRVNCPLPMSAAIPKDGQTRLWSDPNIWPSKKVPQDGDNVEIPGDWTIRLDVSTAKLAHLHVIGDLFFDHTKDNLVLTAQTIWVEGQIYIGNNTNNRHLKKAKIVLTGERNTKGITIGPVQDVSNKVIAVTGNLTIYGVKVNYTYVRLQAPAGKNDNTIVVPSNVDWKVGDDILIAPSQRTYNEYEVRKIQAISNGVITLDSPLSYYHFGGTSPTKVTPHGTLDMRTEVAYLTRNIVIEGTDEDYWGGRIYVGEIYDPEFDTYNRGRVEIEGVEMKNLGQSNTNLAGLTFDRLVTTNNDYSIVRKSVMRDSDGWQLRVIGSDGIIIEENIFYKSPKYQIRIEEDNTNLKFNKNLVIGNLDRGLRPMAGDSSFDMIAMFYNEKPLKSSEVSGNIFAGCFQHCVITQGGDCSSQSEGPYTFNNNVVHSGDIGWVADKPNTMCNGISHYTAYKVDQGVVNFFKSTLVKASKLIISDTKIGMSLNTGSISRPYISIKDSYIAGVSLPGFYSAHGECSELAGIYISGSGMGDKPIPPSESVLPWYRITNDHVWQSSLTISGVTFENFNNDVVAGCINNYAITTNPSASDNSAITTVSGITLKNTTNRIYFEKAPLGWANINDCGTWVCTGIRNVLVKDLDGSFAGTPASLMPGNPTTFDQNTCELSVDENAHICKQIGWGVLTFQSLDSDVYTRVLSPVIVTTDKGFRNDLNSYMDHIWDGFYTGLKRLSRFHSVVQAGEAYKVEFTGSLPNALRWQLQGARPQESITVEYGYTNPQSVRVTNADGSVIKPIVVKSAEERVIKPQDPCGTNIYNIDNRRITIKLAGEENCRLDVALMNSIKLTVRYAVTVEQFFSQNGPTAFIDKVAAVLKINPASIRIVEVRSGSTILDVYIDSNHQEGTEDSDSAANAELKNMIETLKTSISNGDLRILDSDILDSSLDISMPRYPASVDTISAESETSSIVLIVVTVVVGVVALTIGIYFAYKKYKTKRVFPIKDLKVEKIAVQAKGEESPPKSAVCFTENPLVSSPSKFELSAFGNADLSPHLAHTKSIEDLRNSKVV